MVSKVKRNKTYIPLRNYIGSVPDILRYQLITKCWLLVFAFLFQFGRGAVLWTTNRSAVSSGDLPFLMTSVQGWLCIFLGIGLLIVYMVIDINAMILLSSKVIHQQPIHVRSILKESFQSIQKFKSPFGFFLIIYVAFLLPLAGVGLGITLTGNFYMPRFITEVIESNLLYGILYHTTLFLIFIISFYYIFLFHRVILGDKHARDARKDAGKLMRKNWKNFLIRYGRFLLATILMGAILVVILGSCLLLISKLVGTDDVIRFRFVIVFSSIFVLAVTYLYGLLFTPLQWIELTRIYESYTEEDEGEERYPQRSNLKKLVLPSCIILIFCIIFSVVAAYHFDTFFPKIGNATVIAHRGGGNLGNENSVRGLELAMEEGAGASEIDVQRTKDGYYILNHDANFKRVAGESRNVWDMTLNEIRQLEIRDNNPFATNKTGVSTIEEILSVSKNKIILYIELKGQTADRQMVDDLYRIVDSYGMLNQVVFISLKYPLISYMEQSYPKAETGYLCYAAFGDIEQLDADQLILEEEMATPENIDKIHRAGKKVSVWTVNQPINMMRFYSRNVDGIITDEVGSSVAIKKILTSLKEDYEADEVVRVVARTIFVWWP